MSGYLTDSLVVSFSLFWEIEQFMFKQNFMFEKREKYSKKDATLRLPCF